MQHENNPNSAMLKELKQAKEEAINTAATGEGGNPDGQAEELPPETPEVPESEETTEGKEETSEEAPLAAKGESDLEETDGPIRIGGQTFKTQKEAFAYAEQVERDRELTEAHAAGIREALEATRQPVQPDPEPEDDFEQRFYSNPKETLKEIQVKARDEAVAVMKAETQREALWNQFLTEYPDVRRKDAERILNEHWNTIGKMTDLKVAMKTLATKVRSEYEEIISLTRPRTVLSDKKQVVSPSGSAPKSGVTPKKEEAPLAFAAQMRAAFKR